MEIAARVVSLGRIANRIAGRDDVSRVDSNFTWRLAGRHAIGINDLWSHRSASYPIAGQRRQTLGTAGIYYTLLSGENFGTVEWKETS